MPKHIAPSAQSFYESRNRGEMDHLKYMDFAELYADFIVEFEKMEGDLSLCSQWPLGRVGRMTDY